MEKMRDAEEDVKFELSNWKFFFITKPRLCLSTDLLISRIVSMDSAVLISFLRADQILGVIIDAKVLDTLPGSVPSNPKTLGNYL